MQPAAPASALLVSLGLMQTWLEGGAIMAAVLLITRFGEPIRGGNCMQYSCREIISLGKTGTAVQTVGRIRLLFALQKSEAWYDSITMNAWSEPKTQSVPALERGLMILEYLAQSRRGVTLSQLTRKLQLPRSTGHALLLTYQRTGYVHRCEKTGRYCLGFRLQALANQAIGGTSLRTQAAPLLHQLMQETGLTVHLAVMEEGEAILIDRIEAPGSPHLATWVGKRMGLHCTALGKILISELPESVLDDLIRKHGLMRYNENTIASRRTLHLACESVQRLGYAIDDEEEEIGVRCIGAPVRNGAGDIVAAISISGTKTQLENIPARASQVMATAALLSQEISGFSREQQPLFHRLNHAFQLES